GTLRMGIGLADTAMRGPACMGDAHGSGQGCCSQLRRQFADLADRTHTRQALVVERGHAGGIVATVFLPPQSFQQNGLDPSLGAGADNCTHAQSPSAFFCGRIQLAMVNWRVRDRVNWLSGAGLVMVEPAPMVAPVPISTGATSCTSEPMKAWSPISVTCLRAPS